MADATPRDRVLAVAERLFSARGYDSVTLRDIAAELGMRQASLYHHVPGGKESLYVEVTERGLERHRIGLEAALAAGDGIDDCLRRAARWLLSQPPINLDRMVQSDMPAIGREHADHLIAVSFACLLLPLKRAFDAAETRGEISVPYPILLAGSFVTMIEGIWNAGGGRPVNQSRDEMADELIRILLNGVRPRTGQDDAPTEGIER